MHFAHLLHVAALAAAGLSCLPAADAAVIADDNSRVWIYIPKTLYNKGWRCTELSGREVMLYDDGDRVFASARLDNVFQRGTPAAAGPEGKFGYRCAAAGQPSWVQATWGNRDWSRWDYYAEAPLKLKVHFADDPSWTGQEMLKYGADVIVQEVQA